MEQSNTLKFSVRKGEDEEEKDSCSFEYKSNEFVCDMTFSVYDFCGNVVSLLEQVKINGTDYIYSYTMADDLYIGTKNGFTTFSLHKNDDDNYRSNLFTLNNEVCIEALEEFAKFQSLLF